MTIEGTKPRNRSIGRNRQIRRSGSTVREFVRTKVHRRKRMTKHRIRRYVRIIRHNRSFIPSQQAAAGAAGQEQQDLI